MMKFLNFFCLLYLVLVITDQAYGCSRSQPSLYGIVYPINDTAFNSVFKKKDYRFESQLDSVDSSVHIKIYCNRKYLHELKMPNQDSLAGFSLNWIRPTPRGFDISVEYGSKQYYNKIFHFEHLEEGFVLKKIDMSSFDKSDPGKVIFRSVKPPIVFIQDFNILKFTK